MKTDDTRATLWSLIKDTKFGMLTHRHGDGLLHSHPLTTQNQDIDERDALFFFVPKDGDVARHVASDGIVNVSYANTDDDSYVSVAGRAALVEDASLKQRLFNAVAKAWFPQGVEDPNLGLLEVRIVEAEYWDSKNSKMVQLLKMATAAVTGKPPADMVEHRKVAP